MVARRIAVLGLCVAAFALDGCGTDRDPREAGTYYACSADTDCLGGYSCVCGWCQVVGATPVGCSAADAAGGQDGVTDASGSDTGGPADIADSTNAGDAADTSDGVQPADTVDAADSADADDTASSCSPLTWVGCASGKGCYFDEGTAASFCLGHGSLGAGESCKPDAPTPPCGKDKAGKPLLCDVIELKCQPLCKTSAPDCPNNWQCYPLGAKTLWADQAGICAP